jgi:flagellar protein FliO/FliZ
MFDPFGPDMPLVAKFFIAFAVVLALIGLTAWLVRRYSSDRLGGAARGRQPRLAVIDAATIDGRRRLVLIRRDNVEHLLMIGGPTDVVVEPNIVRAVSARDVAREPARVTAAAEPAATRPTPATESTWPLQPSGEPTGTPAPRPSRSSATEEPWLPPEPSARPHSPDSLSGLAAELSTRLTPPEVITPTAHNEPAPRPSVAPVVPPSPPTPAAPSQADQNLAEMAQQLEAALRRAPLPEGRPPVTDPLAAPAAKATTVREFKPRVETKFEPVIETKIETKVAPPVEPKPEPKPVVPAKEAFDNLEEEMASLLGRPPRKA